MTRGRRREKGGRLRRLVVWVLSVVVALCAVPIALIGVYRFVDPPLSVPMAVDLVSGKSVERRWVDLDRISPNLQAAVVTSEDARFCSHGGVDWVEVEVVLDRLEKGRRPRGASTLTMQTMKNLFLWQSRNYVRKAIEVALASIADLVWSKKRTLEIYLNIAEWGPGLYGAEAAARAYFGKPAADLSRREAGLLAVALPNPRQRNPAKPSARHRERAARLARSAPPGASWLACLKS